MDINQSSLKTLAKIALAAMAALFVIAIVFYKERVLFADAAFVVFHIINEKIFAIQENRYGSFITQMFPYFGAKLHLPLKTIIVGYGISFNLFFLSVNAALIYLLKQYRLAILMALYYFLFFSESFIWISEIPQGIAWMFLLYGIMMYLGEKKNNLILFLSFIILGTLTLFTHFVIAIPFLYLWVFFIIERNNWPFSKSTSWMLSGLIVVIIAGKFALSGSATGPEASQLHGVTHFSLKDIIESFSKPEVTMFLYRCLVNYWAGTLVFIIGMVALLRNKQTLLAIWTFLSVTGYVIIKGLTYGTLDGTTQLFHIESEWTAIGIIVATPFVYSFLAAAGKPIGACLLTGIFIARLVYIILFTLPFSARTEMKEQILTQMRRKGITKLAVISTEPLRAKAMLDWGLTYESTIMSSLDGDNPQLTFVFVADYEKAKIEKLKSSTQFFDTWNFIPNNSLNKEYYHLNDAATYQVMTYQDLLK